MGENNSSYKSNKKGKTKTKKINKTKGKKNKERTPPANAPSDKPNKSDSFPTSKTLTGKASPI